MIGTLIMMIALRINDPPQAPMLSVPLFYASPSPNPCAEYCDITVTNIARNRGRLRTFVICTPDGTVMEDLRRFVANTTDDKLTISVDVRHYAPGIYVIGWIDSYGGACSKFIKRY